MKGILEEMAAQMSVMNVRRSSWRCIMDYFIMS